MKGLEGTGALFASDTTIVVKIVEMGESVMRAKKVLGKREWSNNENKEVVWEFGTKEESECKVFGSWIGENEDVANRTKKAGNLWWGMKVGYKDRVCLRDELVETCTENS